MSSGLFDMRNELTYEIGAAMPDVYVKADYREQEPVNGLSMEERLALVESVSENIKRNAVWICSMRKCYGDLHDCMQEGRLRAWRLSGMYVDSFGVPFRGFVMGSVKKTMKNWLLYHGRVVHIPTTAVEVFEEIWADTVIGEDGETIVSVLPQASPEPKILSEDEQEQVDLQLNDMTQLERDVFELFINEGIGPKEIKGRLFIEYAQARRALYRAIHKMRRCKFKPRKSIRGRGNRDKYGISSLKAGETISVPCKANTQIHNSVRYYKIVLGWEIICKKNRGQDFAVVTRVS